MSIIISYCFQDEELFYTGTDRYTHYFFEGTGILILILSLVDLSYEPCKKKREIFCL